MYRPATFDSSFFFQAEDGIRDYKVTGVQTCALPIYIVYLPPIHPIGRVNRKGRNNTLVAEPTDVGSPWAIGAAEGGHRSEERRVGKGGRGGGAATGREQKRTHSSQGVARRK